MYSDEETKYGSFIFCTLQIHWGEGKTEFQPSMIVKKNLHLIGAFSGDARSYSLAMQFIARHQHNFPFHEMIIGRYRSEEVNTDLESMKAMREIKPVIVV